MRIDKKRFEYGVIGLGKRRHIFPLRNGDYPALCLRGGDGTDYKPGTKKLSQLPLCKDCEKDYPAVSRAESFEIFVF